MLAHRTSHRLSPFSSVLLILVGMHTLVGVHTLSSSASAAVVIVSNDTPQTVSFRVAPIWGQTKSFSLAPSRIVRLVVPDRIAAEFRSGQSVLRKTLETNSAYAFVEKDGSLAIEPFFEDLTGGLWSHGEPGSKPPPSVIVPVTLLVDDEQTSDQKVWERRLREQIASASRFLEFYTGVRFEITEIDRWESTKKLSRFRDLQLDFQKKFTPESGNLAIGFTRQFRASKSNNYQHPPREPLFRHLLMPDIQPMIPKEAQLALLVHELGHYLGAVHSHKNGSVMRRNPLIQDKSVSRSGGATFDAPNTLLMNLIADEIRSKNARQIGDIPRSTRLYLAAIYDEMYRLMPEDRASQQSMTLIHEPVEPSFRYTAGYNNGSQRSADMVKPWDKTDSLPKIGIQFLFDPKQPIRWLKSNHLKPGEPTQGWIEYYGGDVFSGRVVRFHQSSEEPDGLPQHLDVETYVGFQIPNTPERPVVRVRTKWLRRIVWQQVAERYQPATAFLRDGRQLAFQAIRFEEVSVFLLRETGIQQFPFAELAELHLPAADPWEAYLDQAALLSPYGTSTLVRWETARGVRLTGSRSRFEAHSLSTKQLPDSWYHRIQPPWCLDPLWIQFTQIRRQWFYQPGEVPLTWIAPDTFSRYSEFAGVRRFQIDRNVERGDLSSGGKDFAWGFGVHATSRLEFPLPTGAKTFRTQMGLDRIAGKGGCVRASIRTDRTLCYQSPLIVGSIDTFDTGQLPIAGSTRLILQVDSSHADRPTGADPFDIRDIFNWLDPLILLDPTWTRAELARRAE